MKWWNKCSAVECLGRCEGSSLFSVSTTSLSTPLFSSALFWIMGTLVCSWSPCLQKCLMNGWKKGWAKIQGKRSCLSPKKGGVEDVDTALLLQSWAGDTDLSGKRSSELRKKRKDRSAPCWLQPCSSRATGFSWFLDGSGALIAVAEEIDAFP